MSRRGKKTVKMTHYVLCGSAWINHSVTNTPRQLNFLVASLLIHESVQCNKWKQTKVCCSLQLCSRSWCEGVTTHTHTHRSVWFTPLLRARVIHPDPAWGTDIKADFSTLRMSDQEVDLKGKKNKISSSPSPRWGSISPPAVHSSCLKLTYSPFSNRLRCFVRMYSLGRNRKICKTCSKE